MQFKGLSHFFVVIFKGLCCCILTNCTPQCEANIWHLVYLYIHRVRNPCQYCRTTNLSATLLIHVVKYNRLMKECKIKCLRENLSE